MELPGGPLFKDVTQLFNEASGEMGLDELILAEGFTLNEAMSAVEIGDPRMDSGAAIPEQQERSPFNPLVPLLPEEVCWILDRTMACEMHWHVGNALAQTVYTCLFLPHLTAISPDFLRFEDVTTKGFDEQRPLKLISLVIRSAVLGMVKCCDLAYRELMKGNVHDGEDWQGEKSDVSLCEGTPPQNVVAALEEAEAWLISNEGIKLPHCDALLQRIQLRKYILRLYMLELPRRSAFIVPFVAEARRILSLIRSSALEPPVVGSPAYTVFDPRITRYLHSMMPLKALTLPPQRETWDGVDGLLNGFELISRLSTCGSLVAWDAAGNFHASQGRWALCRAPYIRSLAQSIFSNGTTILDQFPYMWLVNQFFFELAHCGLNTLDYLMETRAFGSALQTYEEFQRSLAKLLLQHIWAPYHNRPRHRRHLMKTNFDWHALYGTALLITTKVTPRNDRDVGYLKSMPLAVLHWRVVVIRDIVLSGFELDLYSADERLFAYWYLTEVISSHEASLRELLELTPLGNPAHHYLSSQLEFQMVLKEMSRCFFLLLCRKSNLDATRRWMNFLVRYKWALRKEFESITSPDPFLPNFHAYLREERRLLKRERSERYQEASDCMRSSLSRLLYLGTLVETDPSLELCRMDYTQYFLAGLKVTCDQWEGEVLQSSSRIIDDSGLDWRPEICPWFPQPLTPLISSAPD